MRDGTQIIRRGRGRPREYEPEVALERALALFWTKGFSATSLDDLGAATGMNRPSLYRAFGDKQAIYRRAFAQFAAGVERAVEAALSGEEDLGAALRAFYGGALDLYLSSEPALGCFAMCTAPVEAVVHPEMRSDLSRLITRVDDLLAHRFERGGFRRGPARRAAKLAQSVLHSLAIRARSGAPRAELDGIAGDAAAMLSTFPSELSRTPRPARRVRAPDPSLT